MTIKLFDSASSDLLKPYSFITKDHDLVLILKNSNSEALLPFCEILSCLKTGMDCFMMPMADPLWLNYWLKDQKYDCSLPDLFKYSQQFQQVYSIEHGYDLICYLIDTNEGKKKKRVLFSDLVKFFIQISPNLTKLGLENASLLGSNLYEYSNNFCDPKILNFISDLEKDDFNPKEITCRYPNADKAYLIPKVKMASSAISITELSPLMKKWYVFLVKNIAKIADSYKSCIGFQLTYDLARYMIENFKGCHNECYRFLHKDNFKHVFLFYVRFYLHGLLLYVNKNTDLLLYNYLQKIVENYQKLYIPNSENKRIAPFKFEKVKGIHNAVLCLANDSFTNAYLLMPAWEKVNNTYEEFHMNMFFSKPADLFCERPYNSTIEPFLTHFWVYNRNDSIKRNATAFDRRLKKIAAEILVC